MWPLLVWCCCLPLAAVAQAPVSAPSGVIAGMVADAARNTPIARAVVTLSTAEGVPQEAVAWTDASGRFAFGYLPPGRYQLSVTKSGYQATAYGAIPSLRPPTIIQLGPGESRADFVLRMQVPSAVSGVVLDDNGDPLANVQVQALRSGWRRRKPRLLRGASALTDSSGRYQLRGLAPGRYAFAVERVLGGPVQLPSEAIAGQSRAQHAYATQYYPGTDRAAEASVLSIQPGQQVQQIDFQLTAQPVAPIEGRVLLPAGAPDQSPVNITAFGGETGSGMQFGVGARPPDHTFRFNALPPGSYTLVAQATIGGRVYRGVQPVELGPGGVHDLVLPVEAGVDLAGRVSAVGPDAARYAAATVALSPGDDIPRNGPPLRGVVAADGSFRIAGVPPGIWDISVTPVPRGGYIQSMRLGTRDVLTQDMVIGSSTAEPLNIVIGMRGAAVQGDVEAAGPAVRAVVLLAPEKKWRGVLSFYRIVATDERGHFTIAGVRPGNYDLFAFEELAPDAIQDPDFLKPFESAALPITLGEGDNPPLKFKLASAVTREPQ